MRWLALAVPLVSTAIVTAAGCGSDDEPANPAGPDAALDAVIPDATAVVKDAGPDATNAPMDAEVDADAEAAPPLPPRKELATGVHLVARPAHLEGTTSDGFVVFTEVDPAGHTTAKVIALAGGAETTIAASTGTGKDDLRYEIQGRVVFVWSDRSNRIANLTLWSQAAGVVPIGTNVRPGRAAATADGSTVMYLRDVTATSANIVAGPIAGPKTTIGVLNAADDPCWRGIDLGGAGDRLFVRFCASTATTSTLRSFDPATSLTTDLSTDARSALFGTDRVVWTEGSGALKSAAPDGSGVATLSSAVAEVGLSRDESLLAFRNKSGAITGVAPDGGGPLTVVPDGGAVRLGSVAPNGAVLLYATRLGDAGSNAVDFATDVKSVRVDGGATSTIVAGPTSCANCLFDAFSQDGTRVLTIDPIDLSPAANGIGPVRIVDRATGAPIATTGIRVATAAAFGDAGGGAERFVFLHQIADAVGTSYDVTTRSLGATDDTAVVARGVDNLTVQIARSQAVFSFAGKGERAGVWVAPLP